MCLYSGGLIIGRIFASEIWGGGLIFGRAYFFLGGGGGGGAYNRNFTIYYHTETSEIKIPVYGKRERQKLPRDHDFPAIFHVCRLPFSTRRGLFSRSSTT